MPSETVGVELAIARFPWGPPPITIVVTTGSPNGVPIVELVFAWMDGTARGIPMPADMAKEVANMLMAGVRQVTSGIVIPDGIVIPVPKENNDGNSH